MGSLNRLPLLLAVMSLLACNRGEQPSSVAGSSLPPPGAPRTASVATPSASSTPPLASAILMPSREVPMEYEKQFTAVERQLIELPHTSDAILSRALQGEPFPYPPGGESATYETYSGSYFSFSKPFAIPEKVRRVAFAQEGGGVDVVRLRYRAGRYVLTVSHSKHVLAVAIRGFPAKDGESPLARADRAAAQLFTPDVPRDFIQVSAPSTESNSAPTFGCQRADPSRGLAGRIPDWPDYLCWWTRPQEVGFITLKAARHRQSIGKGFVNPGPWQNRDWFRHYAEREQRE